MTKPEARINDECRMSEWPVWQGRAPLAVLLLAIGLLLTILRPTPLPAAEPRDYVWQKLQDNPAAVTSPAAQAARAELIGEVQKMLDAGIVGPAPFTVGFSGSFICFANTGETVFALCEALPYLPGPMQVRVKQYAKDLIARHQPWNASFQIQVGQGVWPHRAPQPPELPRPRSSEVPIVNAYFLWKYADATGDMEAVRAGYGPLRDQFIRRVKAMPEDYAQTTAAIGLARLARMLERSEESAELEARAAAGLKAGADYETAFDLAYEKNVDKGHDWSYPPFTEQRRGRLVVTAFAPEVMRMLREQSQPQVRAHAGAVMDAWARTWFMTRASMPTFFGQYYYTPGPENAPNFMKRAWAGGQHDFGQENSYLTPDVAATLFVIRAYVLGDNAEQLSRYMDVPWTRVGDTYHMQKLLAIIRAAGPPAWVSVAQ